VAASIVMAPDVAWLRHYDTGAEGDGWCVIAT
jgi:hypothetical protein